MEALEDWIVLRYQFFQAFRFVDSTIFYSSSFLDAVRTELENTLDVFKGSEVPGIPCTPRTFLGCFQNCLIVSKIVEFVSKNVSKIV